METFVAVIDVAAHEGGVVGPLGAAWPAEGGWTEQELCGAHGQILIEHTDRAVVEAALVEWLDCPDARAGRYCYAHNPSARR